MAEEGGNHNKGDKAPAGIRFIVRVWGAIAALCECLWIDFIVLKSRENVRLDVTLKYVEISILIPAFFAYTFKLIIFYKEHYQHCRNNTSLYLPWN